MKRKLLIILIFVLVVGTISGQSGTAREIGYASWYGGKFHGRKTANGEIFDTHKLTAAHRTLPFGTFVEVTNLDNDKTVTVRINDRGPFVQGRIIDLSQAAAESLDMIRSGTAKVSIKIIEGNGEAPAPIERPGENRFTIQLGSFSVSANAGRLRTFLENRGFSPDLESVPPNIIRVVLREIPANLLDATIAELRASGINDFLIRKTQ